MYPENDGQGIYGGSGISSNSRKMWYLPHHPVFNDKKPGKISVIFYCVEKYAGLSLNDTLLQGPDLTNRLICVFIGF